MSKTFIILKMKRTQDVYLRILVTHLCQNIQTVPDIITFSFSAKSNPISYLLNKQFCPYNTLCYFMFLIKRDTKSICPAITRTEFFSTPISLNTKNCQAYFFIIGWNHSVGITGCTCHNNINRNDQIIYATNK